MVNSEKDLFSSPQTAPSGRVLPAFFGQTIKPSSPKRYLEPIDIFDKNITKRRLKRKEEVVIDLTMKQKEEAGGLMKKFRVRRLTKDKYTLDRCIIQICAGERLKTDLFCDFHKFWLDRLVVKKSGFGIGLGLFTSYEIDAGQPVPGLIFGGEFIDQAEALRRCSGTLLVLAQNLYIDCGSGRFATLAKFICDFRGSGKAANCIIKKVTGFDGCGQFLIYAAEKLEAGDEITLDFGDDYKDMAGNAGDLEELKDGDIADALRHYVLRK